MIQTQSLTRGLALLCLGLLASCSDSLSEIGESVQPESDKVQGEMTYLQLTASTTADDKVYSTTNKALLGVINDLEYGSQRGEYITQVRTAQDFKLSPEPQDGTIDSTTLRLYYARREGNLNTPIKVEVYEIAKGFTGGILSQSDLESYRQSGTLVGSRNIVPDRDAYKQKISRTDSVFFVSITLSKELGQRIYDLSKSHPEYFATQESFGKNVLGGLLVTPSTGAGYMLQIAESSLLLHYHRPHETKKDSVVHYAQPFVNTELTPHLNGLSATELSKLTAPSTQYTYVKGPAGVTTELTLAADQLQRLLGTAPALPSGVDKETFFRRTWLLSAANVSLQEDNPTKILLNPPTYMLLMTRQQAEEFFKSTSPTLQRGKTYLSDAYRSASKVYNFSNIAELVTRHLVEHATYTSGTGWQITTPLQLRMIPVAYNSTQGSTITLEQELFPYFVRLSKEAKHLRVGFITAKRKQ